LFNKHLMWDQPEDEVRVLDRVDAIVDAARRGRLAAFSAVIKATGEWVSLYRFQKHALDPKLVEMGLWTHDKFWQGRFSLELTAACVDAAFSLSDISTLVGAAAPDNRGSCRILESCGLSPASLVLRQGESGTEVELREFQITREAWTFSRRTDSFAYVATQHRPPPRSAEASMVVGKSADPIIVHSLSPAPEAAAVAERHPESNPVRSSDTSPPPMAWAS
jgi:RimJ/RimL family protein N-acetyltransferase